MKSALEIAKEEIELYKEGRAHYPPQWKEHITLASEVVRLTEENERIQKRCTELATPIAQGWAKDMVHSTKLYQAIKEAEEIFNHTVRYMNECQTIKCPSCLSYFNLFEEWISKWGTKK